MLNPHDLFLEAVCTGNLESVNNFLSDPNFLKDRQSLIQALINDVDYHRGPLARNLLRANIDDLGFPYGYGTDQFTTNQLLEWYLIGAIQNGHLNVVNRLLKIKEFHEALESKGFSFPWHVCRIARCKSPEILDRLLKVRGLKNQFATISNENGNRSSLDEASKSLNLDTVNLLLELKDEKGNHLISGRILNGALMSAILNYNNDKNADQLAMIYRLLQSLHQRKLPVLGLPLEGYNSLDHFMKSYNEQLKNTHDSMLDILTQSAINGIVRAYLSDEPAFNPALNFSSSVLPPSAPALTFSPNASAIADSRKSGIIKSTAESKAQKEDVEQQLRVFVDKLQNSLNRVVGANDSFSILSNSIHMAKNNELNQAGMELLNILGYEQFENIQAFLGIIAKPENHTLANKLQVEYDAKLSRKLSS